MTTKTRGKSKAKLANKEAARNEYYRLVQARSNALMDKAQAEGRGEGGTVGELEKLIADYNERITELVKVAGVGL